MARHDPYGALREANYRLFLSGFVCSSTGLQMMAAAVLWEIYQRTNSALAVGLTGLVRALPVVLLALPAGHVVDSVDRKRVLMWTQLAMGSAALGLAVVSWSEAPLWVMYAMLLLTGCARSFNGPVRSALLPQLVDRAHFQNAVTWNGSVFQFSAICGPILAGAMMGWLGLAWPVYVVTAAGCLLLAFNAAALQPRAVESTAPKGVSLSGMLAGLGHLWREKAIFGALSLDLFAVLLGGATALLPVYASEILHVGEFEYGVLKASPYVGALVMALFLAHNPIRRAAGKAMLWSVAGFGVSIIVFGLSSNFWLSLAALALGGAADMVSVVIRHVLVQHRTPENLRGRVAGVNSVFIECSNELGAFESGLVAKFFGPVFSAVSGGVGTVLVVLGIAWLVPELRKLDRLDEAEDGGSGPGGAGPGGAGSDGAGPGGPGAGATAGGSGAAGAGPGATG
ncbi:MAG: MFS transporter [Planctomycetaceae bacterium]|nr:MFS transporter [Planctomycetaceae bacterium]